MANDDISRRTILTAALAAAAAHAQTQERYRLGVMAGMYAGLPLDEALGLAEQAGFPPNELKWLRVTLQNAGHPPRTKFP